MHSTYILYNIVPIAFLMLLLCIFVDIFLDYFREVKKNNKKRAVLYSFIFYGICLIQIKFGGFTLPQNASDMTKDFISTNEWFGIFDTLNFQIYRWSYSALLYNVLFFIPLGIYLFVLFKLKNLKQAIPYVLISCMVIEFTRLLFVQNGLSLFFGKFDIIYLLFNAFGGVLGFWFIAYTIKRIQSFKLNIQTKY